MNWENSNKLTPDPYIKMDPQDEDQQQKEDQQQNNSQNRAQNINETSSINIEMQQELTAPIGNSMMENLRNQILQEQSKLKETLFRLQNYITPQNSLIHQENYDPCCIEGYIQNFKQAEQSDFPNNKFRRGYRSLPKKYYQFTLTSQKGIKYLILIHEALEPQIDRSHPENTRVRLYLPESRIKDFQQIIDGHQLVIFEPIKKQQKKKKEKKGSQSDNDSQEPGQSSSQNQKENKKQQENKKKKQLIEARRKEQEKEKEKRKEQKKAKKIEKEKKNSKKGTKKEKKNSKKGSKKQKRQTDQQDEKEEKEEKKEEKKDYEKDYEKEEKEEKEEKKDYEKDYEKEKQKKENEYEKKQKEENESEAEPQEANRTNQIKSDEQNEQNPPRIFTVLSDPHLIIQPEMIVNPSSLFSWPDCQRYRTLNKYIRSEYNELEQTLFGKVCHRYMQKMLENEQTFKKLKFNEAEGQILKVYEQYIFQMYLLMRNREIRTDFEYFYSTCEQILSKIHFFIRDHVFRKETFETKTHQFQIVKSQGTQTLHTTKYFALSGKTDALFQAKMRKRFDKKSQPQDAYISFQLKTGFHKSKFTKQTDLFNMLIQQRLIAQSKNIKVIGLTLYVDKNGFKNVRQVKKQIDHGLYLMQRNRFVVQQEKLFKGNEINLPPLFKKSDKKIISCKKGEKEISCKGCYIAKKCEIFHIINQLQSPIPNRFRERYGLLRQNQIIENDYVAIQPQPLPDIEQIIPSDLNPETQDQMRNLSLQELQYAQKWITWLHIEETTNKNLKKQQRKKLQSLKPSNFKITKIELQRIRVGCKRQSFHKQIKLNTQDKDANKIHFIIEKNVNDQKQLQQLGRMYVDQKEVSLTILSIGVQKKTCRIFSVAKILPTTFLVQIQIYTKLEINTGHLDSVMTKGAPINVEIQNFNTQGENTQRLNILNLLLSNNQTLKQLIIKDYQPRQPNNQNQMIQQFSERSLELQPQVDLIQYQKDLNRINEYEKNKKPLNQEQRVTLQKIIGSQFCTLVKGMPGTGKTQLIVEVLAKYNTIENKTKNVLIASFTNRALDNILQRALQLKAIYPEQTMREGNQQKIDRDFLQINSKNLKFKTVDQYKKYFKSKKFWFTTLSSVSTNQLLPKMFDLVILDEASQCLESLCIGALMRGHKIAMIGDFLQLSPIVKSEIPLTLGMAVSLFQRLCKEPNSDSVSLTKQYRMNDSILKFYNTLAQDEKLKTELQQTKTRKIQFDQKSWKQKCQHLDLRTIIDPNNEVIMINHAGISNCHQSNEVQQKLSHIIQVETACVLLFKFLQLGIDPSEITIICLYNKTVDTIRRLIKKIHSKIIGSSNPNIAKLSTTQVLTVDKSQGIDKEVVIFVAEMKCSLKNSLIEERRRVNVAVTRAKMKMIIIGSLTSLSQVKVFDGKFYKLLKQTKQLKVQEDFIRFIMNQFSKNLNTISNQMNQQ